MAGLKVAGEGIERVMIKVNNTVPRVFYTKPMNCQSSPFQERPIKPLLSLKVTGNQRTSKRRQSRK